MSVVAGVLAGFTNQVIVASALGALWIVFVLFLVAFVHRRRAPLKEREADLEQRRTDYNDENYQRTARLVDEEYAKATFHPIEQFERVRW
jgi:C4-dicarboxylate-specific signal transduction histidine kinase